MQPVLRGQAIDEVAKNSLMAVLHFLNRKLAFTGFVAGTEALSVADLALYATVSTLQMLPESVIDMEPYEHLQAWGDTIKNTIPHYDTANGFGVLKVVDFYNIQVLGGKGHEAV